MKWPALLFKPTPEGRGTQLGLLCACGRRPIELKGLRCCRLCYYRQYYSLRWIGGLRELILKRDRFECRTCGAARRLVVHHRDERNAQPLHYAVHLLPRAVASFSPLPSVGAGSSARTLA
jgi:hypothetical protein